MALSPGAQLGSYAVLSPLGAGGMGEVYRAHDSRLGREVAIKVLPEAFAHDPERLARFEREAHILAAFNHPAIAAIHGLEEAGGERFLVLELVEGETLEERLARGPLPLAEALGLARQIAEALEAAHEKGIVHRDLKPANVKVTPQGRVKVLDFGLAKTFDAGTSSADASGLPTQTHDGTRAGAVLGTPSYMSPEQARGLAVDKRTDLWALGCVLYAMLTGRRAFPGATSSDAIAAVLEHEPDWDALPRETPAAIRHLLHRCLEKDKARRLRDAGDARLEIDDALEAARPRDRGARPLRVVGIIAVASAVAALAAVAILGRIQPGPASAVQPRLTQLTFAEGIEGFAAWSPDGRAIAYSAEAGDVRKVFLKSLDAGENRQLTQGDADDIQASWSPDGKSILFVRAGQPGRKLQPGDVFGQYEGGAVWSVELSTGKETKLVDDAFNPSWSPDGALFAVDASWAGPRRLWVLDRHGRNPQQVTSDVSEAVEHLRPRFSPDGKKLVFQNVERTTFDVRVVDISTKALAWITNDLFTDLNPVWSASGRSIYFSSYRSGGLNVWKIPVTADGTPASAPQQLTSGAGQDVDLALSRDGTRMALSILRQNADIWKLPVSPETGKPTGPPQQVVATTREDSRAAWSPDGQSIAFNSDRGGEMNLWVESPSGGAARQITRGPGGDFQPNWSPDASRLAFFSSRAGHADIWVADLASGEPKRLTTSESMDVNPAFSPDGRHIAYQSDRGGRLEVWVMGEDGSADRQLTRSGVTGHFLRWTRDGGSVIYRCPCGGKPQTMRVALDGSEPQLLAEPAGGSHMSFAPDFSRMIDVVGHKALWVSPLASGPPEKVFEFDDADARIDYPVWSPDGRFVLFDRFRPQGGDIWLMDGLEN